MILAAILQLSTFQGMPLDTWAQVSSEQVRTGSSDRVDFISDAAARENGDYTLRLTRVTGRGREILWATSRNCRAVRDAVSAFEALPMPQPQLPKDGTSSVRDGTLYTVRYDARYGGDDAGAMELSSNVDTPLAKWVDTLFAKLSACWSPVRSAQDRQ